MCPGVKPIDSKPCNTKACDPEDDRPHISTTASRYIQHDPNQKTISLKVGGAATIFYGTQVKIKCPVKKYNRTKIKWTKDHDYLTKKPKYKVSKKGALRILDVTFKDGGVYTCHAGQSMADITLTIKAKPGESPTNDESENKYSLAAGNKQHENGIFQSISLEQSNKFHSFSLSSLDLFVVCLFTICEMK